jgi:hypothetical protein
MSSPPKNGKNQKFSIDCASGENCSRPKCSFKHPDGWNAAANQRRIQQKRREDFAQLQLQQRLRLLDRCRYDELCRQVDCHFQHSPGWDPKRNQKLYEEKRLRDDQRREKQQKHAYAVSTTEMIEEKNDFNNSRSQKKSLQNDLIGEEYDYDDEYFDIQEKIWKKQMVRRAY